MKCKLISFSIGSLLVSLANTSFFPEQPALIDATTGKEK
jgi:hypothetical protein